MYRYVLIALNLIGIAGGLLTMFCPPEPKLFFSLWGLVIYLIGGVGLWASLKGFK